jgi:hypothetical protein
VDDANKLPSTAAESIPSPINPPCAGSCPEPPPDINVTIFF